MQNRLNHFFSPKTRWWLGLHTISFSSSCLSPSTPPTALLTGEVSPPQTHQPCTHCPEPLTREANVPCSPFLPFLSMLFLDPEHCSPPSLINSHLLHFFRDASSDSQVSPQMLSWPPEPFLHSTTTVYDYIYVGFYDYLLYLLEFNQESKITPVILTERI